MSETELQVVCRACGSEVSPFVTECPYCGKRLRKRAPKLEHHEDHFEPKPTAGVRLRRRLPRIPAGRLGLGSAAEGAYAIPAVIVAVSAVLLLVRVAGDFSLFQIGAISGQVNSEWWRFLTAPFAYGNVGYLFIVAVALAIFGSGLERALGKFATLVLLIGCGALGAFAGYGIYELFELGTPLIAGGNAMALGAVAAWTMLRRAEVKDGRSEGYDAVGVAVVAVVLLAIPLVEGSADLAAGVAGGLIGGFLGFVAAKKRPHVS